MTIATKRYRRALLLAVALMAALLLSLAATGPAQAATGDYVATINFSKGCPQGLGVGIAFDGSNFWYSCAGSASPNLFKADSAGNTTQSFNVTDASGAPVGLGALAWDGGRNKLWAGAGAGPGQTGSEVYLIDPASGIATLQFNVPGYSGNSLDDGLAYDRTNDTVYHSYDGSTRIRHLSATGVAQGDDNFTWGGSGCYNSGLAIGGQYLYEGSNGCSHIWVVDKGPKTNWVDFTTVVPGDPNFRDEDLECDDVTFNGSGKHVMWSVEAYEPRRAHAFEVPKDSCKVGGGEPAKPPCCTKPALLLKNYKTYWASFADFMSRLLSADYKVHNVGPNTAVGVKVTGVFAGNGVTLNSPSLPLALGNIASAGAAPFTLKYYVPQNVISFGAQIYLVANDECEMCYSYDPFDFKHRVPPPPKKNVVLPAEPAPAPAPSPVPAPAEPPRPPVLPQLPVLPAVQQLLGQLLGGLKL